MKTEKNTLNRRERYQQIVLCARTYYNLHGKQPDASELCKWLDLSYRGEIMTYLGTASSPAAVCA